MYKNHGIEGNNFTGKVVESMRKTQRGLDHLNPGEHDVDECDVDECNVDEQDLDEHVLDECDLDE